MGRNRNRNRARQQQLDAELVPLANVGTREIAKYLLSDVTDYAPLFACITAQLQKMETDEARTAIRELQTLLEANQENPQTG